MFRRDFLKTAAAGVVGGSFLAPAKNAVPVMAGRVPHQVYTNCPPYAEFLLGGDDPSLEPIRIETFLPGGIVVSHGGESEWFPNDQWALFRSKKAMCRIMHTGNSSFLVDYYAICDGDLNQVFWNSRLWDGGLTSCH